jgi:hypothetical protein
VTALYPITAAGGPGVVEEGLIYPLALLFIASAVAQLFRFAESKLNMSDDLHTFLVFVIVIPVVVPFLVMIDGVEAIRNR